MLESEEAQSVNVCEEGVYARIMICEEHVFACMHHM